MSTKRGAALGVAFASAAAVAGCGCGGGCAGGACGVIPPGGGAPPPPMVTRNNPRGYEVGPGSRDQNWQPPVVPYADAVRDALHMTTVVGEATIAAGATTEVSVQPSMGTFDGFYGLVISTDATNPQSLQRSRVGRWSVGDCPGDCRTGTVWSDVYDKTETCCNGKPLRSRFGRAAMGEDLRVEVTNPNAAGSIVTQVIVTGYCYRGACG